MWKASTSVLVGIVSLLCSRAVAREPSDYLPLAVGNSWTYDHYYYALVESTLTSVSGRQTLTITITETEHISGHLYYVFDVPDHDWPFPYFFLAGKKVRLAEDGRLLELKDGEGICLYDFSPELPENPYPIPEHQGDTLVTRDPPSSLPSSISFAFKGHDNLPFFDWETRDTRDASFYAQLGMRDCRHDVWPVDCDLPEECDVAFEANYLHLLYAFIDGVRLEWKDLHNATAASSWGRIKQRFLRNRRTK